MIITLDVYSWIPQPEVSNPLYYAPTLLVGQHNNEPYFGGDNMVLPPATPGAWGAQTFRARQSYAVQIPSRLAQPQPLATPTNGRVIAGTTTLLSHQRNNPLSQVVKQVPATVMIETASAVLNDRIYTISMRGAAQDPVPAHSASRMGAWAGSLASFATPNLEWDLTVHLDFSGDVRLTIGHFHDRTDVAFHNRLAVFNPFAWDPALNRPVGPANIYGAIRTRQFPSYAVYLTLQTNGPAVTAPYYFYDASQASVAGIVFNNHDDLSLIQLA